MINLGATATPGDLLRQQAQQQVHIAPTKPLGQVYKNVLAQLHTQRLAETVAPPAGYYNNFPWANDPLTTANIIPKDAASGDSYAKESNKIGFDWTVWSTSAFMIDNFLAIYADRWPNRQQPDPLLFNHFYGDKAEDPISASSTVNESCTNAQFSHYASGVFKPSAYLLDAVENIRTLVESTPDGMFPNSLTLSYAMLGRTLDSPTDPNPFNTVGNIFFAFLPLASLDPNSGIDYSAPGFAQNTELTMAPVVPASTTVLPSTRLEIGAVILAALIVYFAHRK